MAQFPAHRRAAGVRAGAEGACGGAPLSGGKNDGSRPFSG